MGSCPWAKAANSSAAAHRATPWSRRQHRPCVHAPIITWPALRKQSLGPRRRIAQFLTSDFMLGDTWTLRIPHAVHHGPPINLPKT